MAPGRLDFCAYVPVPKDNVGVFASIPATRSKQSSNTPIQLKSSAVIRIQECLFAIEW